MAIPKLRKADKPRNWHFPWTRRDFVMLGIGLATIIVGYLLMSNGMGVDNWDNPLAVSVAPVILVIGYCVIIPLAIMFGGFHKPSSDA
jgi:hypothetical protein